MSLRETVRQRVKSSMRKLRDTAKNIKRPSFLPIRKIFRSLPRRYFIFAAVYVLTVMLLFAYFTYRWSASPSLEVPGFEKQEEAGRGRDYIEENGEDGLFREDVLLDLEDQEQELDAGEDSPNPFSAYLEDEFLEGEESEELAQEEEQEAQAGEEEEKEEDEEDKKEALPQAADPLHEWKVHRDYGEYQTVLTPSGGKLHQFNKGILLQAEPGAEVAALWGGKVVNTEDKESVYGASLLVEHEKGYKTFYGNLLETWVEKGEKISRGEKIGLMATDPLDFPVAAVGVSAEDENMQQNQQKQQFPGEDFPPQASPPDFPSDEGKNIPMHTVFKGSFPEAGGHGDDSSNEKNVKGSVETTGDTVEKKGAQKPQKEEVMGQKFYEGKPLLYLEIRLNNHYIDPAEFIDASN